jgi:hypothetical protein
VIHAGVLQGGCYAKTIDLLRENELEMWGAIKTYGALPSRFPTHSLTRCPNLPRLRIVVPINRARRLKRPPPLCSAPGERPI